MVKGSKIVLNITEFHDFKSNRLIAENLGDQFANQCRAVFWLLSRKLLPFHIQNMYTLLDNIALKTHKSCRFKI